MPLPIGFREALIDRYLIDRELGSGATATVYLATDLKHQRQVAIKVLRPELAASIASERFLREISIAAQVQHPHILSLLDSGIAVGALYFVMPFLEGETLRARLNREGRLPIADVIRITADVADALAFAHGRGIIHRDIKPDNVMLAGRHAVVMDFGVSKAVNASVDQHLTLGFAIGTPTYMAPEQAMADPGLDHRVDLYGLGVMAYEMLAGRPPFSGLSPQDVLTAQVMKTPESVAVVRPEIPPILANLVMRCLAKPPEERWQSAAEIVATLDPLTTPASGLTPTAVAPTRPSRRWSPWIGSAIGVVGVVAAIWSRTRRPPSPTSPELAVEQASYLGNVIEARVSPDGQFMALVTADSTGQHLTIRDQSPGSRPIELASGSGIRGVSWTADGSEVAFSSIGDREDLVKRIPRLGGVAKTVGAGPAYLSPDGRYLATSPPSGRWIVIRDLRSGDSTRWERPAEYQWLIGLDWSPLSDRLVASFGGPATGRSVLMTITVAGVAASIREDSVPLLVPRFGPDGRSIYLGREGALLRIALDPGGRPIGQAEVLASGLVIQYDDSRSPFLGSMSVDRAGEVWILQEKRSSNLAIVKGDGRGFGPPVSLTRGTATYTAARLSPLGDRVAATRVTSKGNSVGVLPIGGGDFAELAAFRESYELDWSPDGRQIAVVTDEGGLALIILDLERGSHRTVAVGRIGARVSWGPRGIVAQGPANQGLVAIDPTTGTLTRVIGVDTTAFALRPQVDPTGRLVAYTGSMGGKVGLWVASLVNRTTRLVDSTRLEPLRWTGRGDAFYAGSLSGAGTRLMLVPLAGGRPRSLVGFPIDERILDVSPDGRLIILNQLSRQSDLWRLIPASPRSR